MPPPTRGPPLAALAASSFLALASSACFFLNSWSVYGPVSPIDDLGTSSSSFEAFFFSLRGFSFPPELLALI
jgi:hypothetical protein